jgi:hypothetical protein
VIRIRFSVGRYSRQKQAFSLPTGTEYTLDCSLRRNFNPLPPTTLSAARAQKSQPTPIPAKISKKAYNTTTNTTTSKQKYQEGASGKVKHLRRTATLAYS